jgi:methyl-accepting chemotaxis protein
MDSNVLLAVMTFFVFLCALAMCVQAGLLFGIWKAVRTLQQQTASVMPQVRSVLGKAETTLEESRKNIVDISAKASEISTKMNEIATKANDIMDSGKVQMAKLDAVVTDASSRAKVQLERAELVVDDTMTRVHQSVTAVHNGVLRPVREIQGLTAGIRTAVQHFLRGGRPSVAQATQDDEMFI